MFYNQFRDIPIPALGLGCLRLPRESGDPQRISLSASQALVDLALEQGVNLFDTAHTYQNTESERILGETLSRHPRERYYLSTKFKVGAGTDVKTIFEAQLARCKTEYFDFYLLHNVDENSIADYIDFEKGGLSYLRRQKAAGRIRYLGFSSHGAPETIARFLDCCGDFDMGLLQLNYLDWAMLQARAQHAVLTERGIPIWVMEPLRGGRLSTLNPEAAAILKAVQPDRSLSSWGFRFLMGLPNVHMILSGMSDPAQVLDNCKTFEKPDPLSPQEAQALWQALEAYTRDLGVPCTGCRYCCGPCPQGLDIPLLIRRYNERRGGGDARRIADRAGAKGPESCMQCGSCLKHCPQRIDIPGVLALLAAARQREE